MMYLVKRLSPAFLSLLLVLLMLPNAGQAQTRSGKQEAPFDPIEFLHRFKMGMSYTEVQNALPKGAEQDILSYIVTDEVFVLTIDLPNNSNWSASFKFSTLDSPMRRPEQLVELNCSADLSSRSETFESIVNKVTAVFGEPAKLDRTESEIKQAGWRVGGSVLTLEYSIVPSGQAERDVSIDFVIKKNRRRDSSQTRAVA